MEMSNRNFIIFIYSIFNSILEFILYQDFYNVKKLNYKKDIDKIRFGDPQKNVIINSQFSMKLNKPHVGCNTFKEELCFLILFQNGFF